MNKLKKLELHLKHILVATRNSQAKQYEGSFNTQNKI